MERLEGAQGEASVRFARVRYLAAGPDLLDMSLLSSGSVSFVSKNLRFGLDCLLRELFDLPEARTGIPTEEYMRKIGDIVRKSEGWAMAGCAFVLDGSINYCLHGTATDKM